MGSDPLAARVSAVRIRKRCSATGATGFPACLSLRLVFCAVLFMRKTQALKAPSFVGAVVTANQASPVAPLRAIQGGAVGDVSSLRMRTRVSSTYGRNRREVFSSCIRYSRSSHCYGCTGGKAWVYAGVKFRSNTCTPYRGSSQGSTRFLMRCLGCQ